MKHFKNYLILLFFLTFIVPSFGQNQIVYDFHKGVLIDNGFVENGKIKPISTNDFAVFKIININTFRFKAEIEGRSITYLTEMPSELQTIFRQPRSLSTQNTNEGIEEAQEAVEKMKVELTSATKKAEEKSENVENASNVLSQAKADLEKEKSKVEKATKVLRSARTTSIQKDNSKKDTTGTGANIKNLLEKIDDAQDQLVAAESSEAFKTAMEKLVKACNDYLRIAEKVAAIKIARIELINLSKQDWGNWQQMRDNLPSINTEAMKSDFKEFVKFYAQAVSLYRAAKITATAAGASKEELKLIEEASQQLEEGHHQITEDNFLKLIDDIMVLDKAMQNQGSFIAISPPIQINGDYVAFDVKTPPAQVNDLLPYTPSKTFRIEIPAKGGWKADFSVGPAFSFGNGSKNAPFFFNPDLKDATKVLLKKGTNKNVLFPALVAMMHAYPRSGKNHALGGMFGVGANFTSVDDLSASYYLGLSCIVGKQQKITLSGGASALRVDRLKSNYAEGNSYPNSLSIGDVTEKAFILSPFLSISYNITNRIEVK